MKGRPGVALVIWNVYGHIMSFCSLRWVWSARKRWLLLFATVTKAWKNYMDEFAGTHASQTSECLRREQLGTAESLNGGSKIQLSRNNALGGTTSKIWKPSGSWRHCKELPRHLLRPLQCAWTKLINGQCNMLLERGRGEPEWNGSELNRPCTVADAVLESECIQVSTGCANFVADANRAPISLSLQETRFGLFLVGRPGPLGDSPQTQPGDIFFDFLGREGFDSSARRGGPQGFELNGQTMLRECVSTELPFETTLDWRTSSPKRHLSIGSGHSLSLRPLRQRSRKTLTDVAEENTLPCVPLGTPPPPGKKGARAYSRGQIDSRQAWTAWRASRFPVSARRLNTTLRKGFDVTSGGGLPRRPWK